MRCEVNIIKGSRCNVIMRLQIIVLYAGVGVCDDETCNQATWWSDVIASREYNGIVSIHIMLLTANLSQSVDCSDQSHCTRCGFSLRGELKRIVFS